MAENRRGNPNFGKKETQEVRTPNRKGKPTFFIIPGRKFDEKSKTWNVPSSMYIPSNYVDGDGETREYIINYRSQKMKDGTMERIPVTGDIPMNNGRIVVEANNPTLLKFLREHDYNGSNPNRDKSKRVLFIEEDTVGEKIAAGQSRKKVLETMAWFNEKWENERKECLDFAIGQGFDIDEGDEYIYAELILLLERDPKKFVNSFESSRRDYQKTLRLAEQKNVLTFHSSNNKWVWSATQNEYMTVPSGKNGYEFMVEHLMANENAYEALKREVEKAG